MLPLVDKSNAVETRTGVSFQHPEIIVHAELITSTLSEPYYWKLPEQFKGSMVGNITMGFFLLFVSSWILLWYLQDSVCIVIDANKHHVFPNIIAKLMSHLPFIIHSYIAYRSVVLHACKTKRQGIHRESQK